MNNDRVLKEPNVHDIYVLDMQITNMKADLEIKKNTLNAVKDNFEVQALKKNFRGRKAALAREVGFTDEDKEAIDRLTGEVVEITKQLNTLKAERNYKQNLLDVFKSVSYSKYWRNSN